MMRTRRDQLTAEVTARLTRVRGDLTDAAFATLVRDVVDTTLHFEGHGTPAVAQWTIRPPSARCGDAR